MANITYTSFQGYIARVNGDGVLRVDRAPASARVQVTRVDATGTSTEVHGADSPDASLARLVAGLQASPIVLATRENDGHGYSCDVDCGFQRWRGAQSGRAVGAALHKLGFAGPQVARLLRAVQPGYCPRVY